MSRPDRGVGARDARGVAEARARSRGSRSALLAPARRAACATSTLASTCGRCETVAISAVVRRRRRSPSGARRAPASSGAGARRARPRSRARRRQVPGGAVEQVRARVLDARRLGARERVAADEARGRRPARHDGALGRADVGDDAVRPGAPRSASRDRARRARRRARRRTRRRRRRSAAGVGGGRVDRRRARAPRSRTPGRGPSRRPAAPSALAGGAAPTEPPISPTPRTATLMRAQRAPDGACSALPATAAACSTCSA